MKQEIRDAVLHNIDSGNWVVYPKTGQVFSVKLNRFMATRPDRNGYIQFGAHHNGKQYGVSQHCIIWLSVHRDIPDGIEVDHINQNRADNRIENLQLLTRMQNNINSGSRGEANPTSKLTEADVIWIRNQRSAGKTVDSIASELPVCVGHVYRILRNTSWKNSRGVTNG